MGTGITLSEQNKAPVVEPRGQSNSKSPSTTVLFTINDTGDSNNGAAFDDNKGFLKVEWNCEDCK